MKKRFLLCFLIFIRISVYSDENIKFIVAYFADNNSNIIKVASNYVSVDVYEGVSKIIYMHDLMFTTETKVNLNDTLLTYGDINNTTMFTDAYDYANGLSLSIDKPGVNLNYAVFKSDLFG